MEEDSTSNHHLLSTLQSLSSSMFGSSRPNLMLLLEHFEPCFPHGNQGNSRRASKPNRAMSPASLPQSRWQRKPMQLVPHTLSPLRSCSPLGIPAWLAASSPVLIVASRSLGCKSCVRQEQGMEYQR